MSSTTSREHLASMIRDLLTIARVAMPPDLFAIDPRVKRGQSYLVALGPFQSARPPNTDDDQLKALLGDILDLRPVDASKMVLDWDLVDAVLAARDHGLSLDDNEALNFIVRDWLVEHGYLDVPPEDTQ
ncbi:MAG: hypothetical protein ACTHOI_02520 [Sphingomicrobium sp.]|jgi:hypothetical protein